MPGAYFGLSRHSAPHLYTTLAPFYDRLDGAARDYAADVRWLDGVFKAHRVRTVLDVACGTGAHARGLARHGYLVTAMDASPSMLRVARHKAIRRHLLLRFVRADYRTQRFAAPFDAAVCMYWTLGAHLQNDELRGALTNIRRYLRPGGLFVFDVENADGIRRAQLDRLFYDYSIHEGDTSLVRFNHSRLESANILDWQAFYFLQRRGKLTMLHDAIKLRFFDVRELRRLLDRAKFRLLDVWGGPGRPYDPTGPSIYVVALRPPPRT